METEDQNSSKSDMFQRYRIKEKLKEGAFGSLLVAEDTQSGVEVLIKIASPWMSKDEMFKAYVYDRWAEKETLFEHPNIAGVIEVGKSDERYFLVTEYPGGHTLADDMKGKPLGVDRSIRLLHDISEALRAAHRRQIAGGHLKPSDVFIPDGESPLRPSLKVMMVDMDVDVQSGAGALFSESYGMPKYMAPEVIKGKKPSPRSDIFALGVIGYEMLTGKAPFASEHPPGYFFTNCTEEPAAPHEINHSVPHELSMTIMKCLEKTPSRRYHSIQRFIDDLDRCREIVHTGTCDLVPAGTDSALAGDYSPSAGREKTKIAGSTPALTKLALFLAVAALIFTVGANLPRLRGVWPVRDTEAPRNGEVAEPDVESEPDPEVVFAGEFDALVGAWEDEYRPAGRYDDAIDEFLALARKWSESEEAEKALNKAAFIYLAWGDMLAEEKDFAGAEEKYRKAEDTAAEGSSYENILERKMPSLLLARAMQARSERRYGDAAKLAKKLSDDYSDAQEARRAQELLPAIAMQQAQEKKDQDEIESAILELQGLVKDFPDSREARQASEELLPALHLESVRAALAAGDIEAALEHEAVLEEYYPASDELETALGLRAEWLLEKMTARLEDDDREAAGEIFKQLRSEFPETDYAFQAERLWAGFVPVGEEDRLAPDAAEQLLSEAEANMEKGRFQEALETLEKIVRATVMDSVAGREAFSLIPECIYKGAVEAYGRGESGKLPEKMEHILDVFEHTRWAERAMETLNHFEAAPDGMAYVPAGSFIMGADREDVMRQMAPHYRQSVIESEDELNLILELQGYVSEMPAHTVRTGAFYIDVKPVTKSEYKDFIEAAGHRRPGNWPEDLDISGREDFPVTGITYHDALEYSQWAGKRLPTEEEWEKSARGVDGRHFPWGDEFEEDMAHHMKGPRTGVANVGSYPDGAGPYGVLDMIGNVWEWTSSHFLPYDRDSAPDRRAPYGEDYMVLRGGAWWSEDTRGVPVSVTRRLPAEPGESTRFIGFRCVKDVD